MGQNLQKEIFQANNYLKGINKKLASNEQNFVNEFRTRGKFYTFKPVLHVPRLCYSG